MKRLLHVGCGTGKLPDGYGSFKEIRLDYDATSEPDIVASIVAMPMIEDQSFECVFASHVIEHLHFHEVGMALREFHRVLKPGGVLEVFVPDLQTIGGRIALDELDVPVYLCSMGPITPLDMLYGHRASIAKGEPAMGHKTGFTGTVLKDALRKAGFEKVVLDRDKGALELRGKAIKSNPLDDPSKWFFSAVNDPKKWEYSGKEASECPQNQKPNAECSTPISATPG